MLPLHDLEHAPRMLQGKVNRRRAAGAVRLAAAASVATRWGVVHAGLASARDPKYTVVPQRKRLTEQAEQAGE